MLVIDKASCLSDTGGRLLLGAKQLLKAYLIDHKGVLVEVEVNVSAAFVSAVAPEVAAHDDVPVGLPLIVEALLDVASDLFALSLRVEGLDGLFGSLNCVFKHIVRHVRRPLNTSFVECAEVHWR